MGQREADRRREQKRREDRRGQLARSKWACKNPKGCGFVFDPKQIAAHLTQQAAAMRVTNLFNDDPTTHVCPRCNTFHFMLKTRNGVRLLTPEETFRLHVDVPNAAALAETYRAAPGRPELILAPVEG